ncbi:MAG: hypothetical protein WD066_19640 [Planctomycetaceae bacterium]
MARKRQKPLFPEMEKVIASLMGDERQDLVILFIPSHDKNQKEIPDQAEWANAAMELFGEQFRGATAFEAFAGVYRTDDGKVLWDKPILIESYMPRDMLLDPVNLRELLQFAKRMGRETNQAAVGMIVNSVFHEITDLDGGDRE